MGAPQHVTGLRRAGVQQEHSRRLALLRRKLDEHSLSAVLLTSPHAIYYYTGFRSTGYYLPHTCLITPERCFLGIRDFESGPARGLEAVTDLYCWTGSRTAVELIGDAFEAAFDGKPVRCGYEDLSNFMPAFLLKAMHSISSITLIPLGQTVDRLRRRKSAGEIALVREAGLAATAGIDAGLKHLAAGTSEISTANAMLQAALAADGDIPASFPYAYFGRDSWCRMRQPTRRRLAIGDPFYLECGACREQYGAAILRSGMFGAPGEYVAAYGAALEAFEAMEARLVPGTTSGEIDRAATESLARHRLDRYRLLKAGYSIGVGFAPGWGEGNVFDISEASPERIEDGMTLHLVMVLMLENFGAIGLSETMLVERKGARSLTPYDRTPLVIDPANRTYGGE